MRRRSPPDDAPTVAFDAVLELHGKTATGITVPAELVEALDRGKRVPVVVSIGPHSYRSTIAPMGGLFLIPVSAENRTAAGAVAGETVRVTLTADDAPREVAVPDDLAAALAGEPGLRQAFDGLSFTHRKEHVRSVEEAKKAETRERRIAAVVAAMRTRDRG